MKTMKSKLLMLTLLLIGVVAMSFTLVNKGKSEPKTVVKAPTTWHYTDTENPGVYTDAANWEKGSASCGLSGTKPCQISVEASDETELAAYFSGMDNDDVLAINPTSRRN